MLLGHGHAGSECPAQLEPLLVDRLLPLVPDLLAEEEPIPTWAMHTVSNCLCAAPAATLAKLRGCGRCVLTCGLSHSGGGLASCRSRDGMHAAG